MERERITVYDMIVQVINGNQLSVEEEVAIMELLRERGEEREKKRMSRCLAGVIDEELKKKVEAGIYKESTKDRYYPIYRKCFRETKIGNLDASELSETVIKEFIIEAHEFFGINNQNDMTAFMRLLQMGLNSMSDQGLLLFVPDKKLYKKHIEFDKGIKYIDNPYSPEEVNKILNWVEIHLFDSRGLAVALWLSSNIAPEEIVFLEKADCWEEDNELINGKGIFAENTRLRIVKEAFNLHPESEQYIFMIKRDNRWRRLNDNSLQIKLYYICQDVGITYRAFHKDEAIIPDV